MIPFWVRFVAGRYLRVRRREKGNTAALLSVLGIAVGVATLLVVLGVMNGFQSSTVEAILRFDSFHLRVLPSPESDPNRLARLARETAGVAAAFPFGEAHGLLRGVFADPVLCTVRIVPADFFPRSVVVAGYPDSGEGVLLGAELARRLGLQVGDKAVLVVLSGATTAEVELAVTGLVRTGHFAVDFGWAFIGPAAAAGSGLADRVEVGVLLEDRFSDGRVAARLADTVQDEGTVVSWREYNRALFGALRTEKLTMMVLIGLIFLVVGGNIYQSLRRSVAERWDDLAVLKALGGAPRDIRLVYIIEGFFIGAIGASVGLALGFFLSGNINEVFATVEGLLNQTLRLLRLTVSGGEGISLFSPRHFYIDEIPSLIPAHEALVVYVIATASSTAAGVLASARITTIRPQEVLREE